MGGGGVKVLAVALGLAADVEGGMARGVEGGEGGEGAGVAVGVVSGVQVVGRERDLGMEGCGCGGGVAADRDYILVVCEVWFSVNLRSERCECKPQVVQYMHRS